METYSLSFLPKHPADSYSNSSFGHLTTSGSSGMKPASFSDTGTTHGYETEKIRYSPAIKRGNWLNPLFIDDFPIRRSTSNDGDFPASHVWWDLPGTSKPSIPKVIMCPCWLARWDTLRLDLSRAKRQNAVRTRVPERAFRGLDGLTNQTTMYQHCPLVN